MVEAWPHTLPWAVALARESRRLGALPMVVYEDEAAYWDSVDAGEAKVLGRAAAHEWAALGRTDVYIHMWGPGDRVRLNALPPKQQEALVAYNDGWYGAARKAGVRGLRLEVGRPYPALAEAYGVDLRQWIDQVVAGSTVDPAELARRGARLAKALRNGASVRLTHANGTDLTLRIGKAPARLWTGQPLPGDRSRPFDLLASVPSGALRIALDETVAEGTLVANRTCYYDDGTATGARFRFGGGQLQKATFARGAERFEKPYAKGGRGRDRPGYLTFGLNPALHDTPQLEDGEAGAVLLAVGGNRFAGGQNASPFGGWAVVAGAKLEVGGRSVPLPG